MKINGASVNNIVNLYNGNKKNVEQRDCNVKSDSLEISTLGKKLSNLSLDDKFKNSHDKIEQLKNEIKSGTYKPDEKQIAKKMLDIINEREV